MLGPPIPIHAVLTSLFRFDILGSTFTSPKSYVTGDISSTRTLSLLQDAEGNHCSSFPATLLQLVQAGAHLLEVDHKPEKHVHHEAGLLLQAAEAFDPLAWATNLQSRSPTTDLLYRAHLATAHRAAVCIYLSRVSLSLNAAADLRQSFDSLVAEIINNLSVIRLDNPVFPAIAWPAFVAGAETNDPTTQEWVKTRFQELWEVQPWGTIKGALGVLESIWQNRNIEEVDSKQHDFVRLETAKGGWLSDMKSNGVNWLII